MKREIINNVFTRPEASAGDDIRGVNVTVNPSVAFFESIGEVAWMQDVLEVKVWMCEVHGRATVSKNNQIVISARSHPLVSDTLTNGDQRSRPHTVNLAPGTIVQAGVSVVMRSGFRTVTAAVGIVPEVEEDLDNGPLGLVPFVDDTAYNAGKSRTHRVSVTIQGVIPLTPQDAELISNLRQDVADHGEDHVRKVLELVTSA